MLSYAAPPDFITSHLSLKFHHFLPNQLLLHRLHSCVSEVAAFSSKTPPGKPIQAVSKGGQWDSMTARFAGASNIPFLLIQIPQILLNQRNLASNNSAALFAVPWLGMLTCLLGNLTLLSYFAKKKEKEAILVQTLGVVSIYIVIVQLAVAGAMPLLQFTATSAAVVAGLVLNFMNYYGWLLQWVWQIWEDFITIVGISVLPQVMWSTFVPYIPSSNLPGLICCSLAIVVIILWTNYINPDNIRGLAALTLLLGMIGNGLMIPRALFIRDLMWFTGATWASLLQGWGNLAWMYCLKSISSKFFWASTVIMLTCLGMAAQQDRIAHGYSSPFQSIKELFFGTR
ncbi:maltose excess protein 1-like, chloroplastic isoform X3 [Phalaenopsis equestris]|uniref:maltose excess protein 1-like, chloroplastic isoform X3 n=1 Tax=Phalaenopsis equestris TaxID=78828 RepID=UPI0009E3A516|nr:maltose excess protein 1-like, chloroplastic isoform X3 [Phalaenopsis equestris]